MSIFTMYTMGPLDPGNIKDTLKRQHQQYFRKARFFKWLYYAFRIVLGLSAVLLPFIVGYSQVLAIILSIIVAAVTVLDTIFTPREHWKLNSTVSNKLWVEEVKRSGEYEKYKNEIDEILRAEGEELELAISIQDLKDQIKKDQPTPKNPS